MMTELRTGLCGVLDGLIAQLERWRLRLNPVPADWQQCRCDMCQKLAAAWRTHSRAREGP